MKCAGSELTYCTNVHPGERWADVREHLEHDVPAVHAALGHGGPFAVGLRLSARAASELASRRERELLRSVLHERGSYVVTANGFPFGAFHGTRVKGQVFRPDWRHPARLAYSDQLAELMAELLPDGVRGSISTVPGAGRDAVNDPLAAGVITERMLRHAARLVSVERRTGKRLCLAIEPEPFAYLETTEEAVSFFEQHLFARAAVKRFAAMTRTSASEAEVLLHRHLGLCLDACHMAVMWEDARGSLARAAGAGVRIAKLQVSAALEVDFAAAGPEALDALERFDDGVYLHQVVERAAHRRWCDLDEAIAETRASRTPSEAWRVHVHVPVFSASMPPFRSTQDYLREVLAACLESGGCPCFEVETYTWSVLPDEHRQASIAHGIARELEWTRARLAA